MSRTNDNCYLAEPSYPTFITGPTPCRKNPDLFTAYGDRQGTRKRREDAAKAVCQTCPLMTQCRAWAVATHQIGVWGATTAYERTMIRNRRLLHAA